MLRKEDFANAQPGEPMCGASLYDERGQPAWLALLSLSLDFVFGFVAASAIAAFVTWLFWPHLLTMSLERIVTLLN
jgi:hypothetical protein